jgi:hypothetical protein
MNHTNIVKNAWHFVRHYRALWIFGMILALTTASWGGISLFGDETREGQGLSLQLDIQPGDTLSEVLTKIGHGLEKELDKEIVEANRQLDQVFLEVLNEEVDSDIGSILLILGCFIVVTYMLAKAAGYISETAMIRMVVINEKTRQRYRVREALHLGWSRSAWQLFLLDLAIAVLKGAAIALFLVLGLAPWLAWRTGNVAAGVAGMITSLGIFILGIFLMIVALGGLSLLIPVVRRVCVLEGLGVWASVRRGVTLVRQQLHDTGLIWLISVSLRFAWPLLLAPVTLLLTVVGGVIGGAIALLVYEVSQLGIGLVASILLATSIGIPIFMLVLIVPLLFLGGLREVFLSSLWTLAFQELRGVSPAKPADFSPDAKDPINLEAAVTV